MANELMKSHHDVVVEIGTHLLNSEEEYMISVCHYSTFLDLEASVSRDDEVDSPYEDNDEDFIAEEDSSDGTTGSTTFEVFDRGTASTVAEESQAWTSFLERARSRANELKSSLETDVRSDIGLFDVPASELLLLKCFCGWEESVVLHIGRCARPELGIKAAFITPLVAETVWLEAAMSPNLKVVLHAISPEDSRRALASSVENPFMPGCWVKVRHGRSRGDVGIVSKMYPWGCKVLFVPRLYLPHDTDRQRQAVGSQPELKLFDLAAIEQAGHHIMKEGRSSYRFQGSKYDHDLLARHIYFSQLEIANEITEKLADQFVQSGHPLVRRSLGILPKVSEWCFQVGEVVTDISKHISGTIFSVGEHELEVEFADGLFPVRWADCKKEFEIGTYVEITGEEHATRWSGWVHAIDNGLLHLISRSGPENERIEIRGVHPNSVSVIALPNITSIHRDGNPQRLDLISIVPWKGVMVQVVKHGHHWRGKTGYVVDVNIVMDQQKEKEVLQFLVQLSHYDPNAPFVSLWFGYHDIVDEESWLPLNEARPIVKDTDFFRHVIPVTNVLGKRGRRPPPVPVAPPRSVTPQPDPTEQCLSPAWNPSSPDPPPIKYWCLDHRLLNARFRVQYNNLKITALVNYDIRLHEIVCIRDDTPLRTILDPARVLAIHPKVRHYDMFLVISGEHCGKWVRSVRFHKHSPTDSSDLDCYPDERLNVAPGDRDEAARHDSVKFQSTLKYAQVTASHDRGAAVTPSLSPSSTKPGQFELPTVNLSTLTVRQQTMLSMYYVWQAINLGILCLLSLLPTTVNRLPFPDPCDGTRGHVLLVGTALDAFMIRLDSFKLSYLFTPEMTTMKIPVLIMHVQTKLTHS
ncbi:hypothetical protein EDD18DRAFT_1114236 [Armillaria luteobubalina]|uniref:Chromatin elongation factor SPT5 n=1 Tax=Armillaria luteobubalina TaxID=153913 RepID=A0AA39P6M2_9AGAR|nr:hypothetical protein EDD18DRAFT_1114236 [Armillaria luteobubalina]